MPISNFTSTTSQIYEGHLSAEDFNQFAATSALFQRNSASYSTASVECIDIAGIHKIIEALRGIPEAAYKCGQTLETLELRTDDECMIDTDEWVRIVFGTTE